MMELLPAQAVWVEEACLELLDGQLTILRALPSTGKSTLATAIAGQLGPSCLILNGRSLNGDSWDLLARQLKVELASLVQEHGCAQLVFDDYPHALRWGYGVHLQRTLLHVLVDGPLARDIGAILIGRWGRSMHLQVRGSPLIARATSRPLPTVSELDALASGLTSEQSLIAEAEVGGNCSLLPKVRQVGGALDFSVVRECLEQLSGPWVDDLPWEAVLALQNTPKPDISSLRDTLAWEAVQPMLCHQPDGEVMLLQGLTCGTFSQQMNERSPAWPAAANLSVERYADLLSGVNDAIWVDRYLAKDPPALLRFLTAVRGRTSTRLRLLLSSSVTSDSIRHHSDVMRDIANLHGVEMRSMSRGHFTLLHDRHLVFLGDVEGGVVLPITAVILSEASPGSAVAVYVPYMPRRLVEEAWAAALPAERWIPAAQ
jgi:hypothetical protein